MADSIPVKDSPCYSMYNSLITTSTPLKNLSDSGYNTPSSTLSNASSNLNRVSEESPSFDHTPFGILCSNVQNPHRSERKLSGTLGDITNTTYSDVNFSSLSTSQECSPTKRFKSSLEAKLLFYTNTCPEDDENHFIKRKNLNSQKYVVQPLRSSMEGREKIDIIDSLASVPHITEKIFSFLSDNDIISTSMVCKTWCDAVKNSPVAQKKKTMYFKISKENRMGFDSRGRYALNSKGCLANISNVMRSPSKKDFPQRSPPVSPSKFRTHLYQKEAKKLSSNEQLMRCPRCSRPALWSPSLSTRAECKGLHCKFVFCTDCLCEYSNNGKHECLLAMPISSYNRRLMTSNLNKRKHNLRRLCR